MQFIFMQGQIMLIAKHSFVLQTSFSHRILLINRNIRWYVWHLVTSSRMAPEFLDYEYANAYKLAFVSKYKIYLWMYKIFFPRHDLQACPSSHILFSSLSMIGWGLSVNREMWSEHVIDVLFCSSCCSWQSGRGRWKQWRNIQKVPLSILGLMISQQYERLSSIDVHIGNCCFCVELEYT